MAASHSYLPYAQPVLRAQISHAHLEHSEHIRLVHGFHRVLLKLTCPSHRWNWPRPIQGEKPDGFDAHQTCFKCMTERFYNTRTLQAGPLFRRLTLGTEERAVSHMPERESLRGNWEKRIERFREFRSAMKAILTTRRQQA
ncbi:MAG TPA: hypothetical protein VFB43_15960 [Terracidiphilus sp.]|nr:hypothetical protein [Terracidiphilus sp.]